MNIYFDTEFTGLHKNTSLISIGMVSDDGKSFYAECNDFDRRQVNDWIKENVIENLYFQNQNQFGPYGSRYRQYIEIDTIATNVYLCPSEKLKGYLTDWFSQWSEPVHLVSDVCHYDMVLLIDIFGSAFDLPKNVNAACHDINQDIAKVLRLSETEAFNHNRERLLEVFAKKLEDEGMNYKVLSDIVPKPLWNLKHNSLYDAYVIKLLYDYITKLSFHWE